MDETLNDPSLNRDRAAGIAFGVLTHILFACTVWHLFWFLKGGPSATSISASDRGLLYDVVLALQFAIPHSILLFPSIRRRLNAWIGPEFYGCFFCLVTCLTLLILFAGWRGSPRTIWDLQGPSRWVCEACFYLSWGTLLYSLSLTGLGYQTGWTEWWHWFRRLPLPRREFRPRGAYLWLRHPVYLSFLGLIWFTPRMTVDHAVLTGIWTVYILVGSHLKDKRLAFYMGATYRRYQQQVAGYPLVFSGPLGRHRVPAMSAPAISAPAMPTAALPPTMTGKRRGGGTDTASLPAARE